MSSRGAHRDAVKARALERDEKALALRLAGKDYTEIAKELGFGNRSNAFRAVKRRLDERKRHTAELADQIKTQELLRLDTMLAGLWAKAKKGDPAAVDRVLRIQERRTAYEGLDMPRALKVELARELDTHLERLKAGLPPDVYEQVLSVFAGEHGETSPGDDARRSASDEEDRDDEHG